MDVGLRMADCRAVDSAEQMAANEVAGQAEDEVTLMESMGPLLSSCGLRRVLAVVQREPAVREHAVCRLAVAQPVVAAEHVVTALDPMWL